MDWDCCGRTVYRIRVTLLNGPRQQFSVASHLIIPATKRFRLLKKNSAMNLDLLDSGGALRFVRGHAPRECFSQSALRGGNEPPGRGLPPRAGIKRDFSENFDFHKDRHGELLNNPKRSETAFYSLENSHNPFAFNGRFAAIFMVRLWLERAMIYS